MTMCGPPPLTNSRCWRIFHSGVGTSIRPPAVVCMPPTNPTYAHVHSAETIASLAQVTCCKWSELDVYEDATDAKPDEIKSSRSCSCCGLSNAEMDLECPGDPPIGARSM
nr:hypothetical protein CFP56_30167 [Quercus suber]